MIAMAAVLRLVFLFLLCCVGLTRSLPRFLHGRPRGGMVGAPRRQTDGPLPPDQWLEQKLDHFNDADLRTWKQRYFVNDTFYKPGGPVFLMIGGEGTANPIWMVEGTWIVMAQRLGALCLMLEHRFYGESHPTPDLSVENLSFLNSEQALADLAHFRQFMAMKMNLTTNKCISFGGSYPGSLSAWYRLKYPHLVDGAVATSAPVLAQLDFTGYVSVVRDSLATTQHGSECNKNIQLATAQVEQFLMHMVGWSVISKSFKLCNPLNGSNPNDVSNFFESIAGNFFGVVQYNKDNRKFEGAIGTDITIDTLCDIMVNASIGKEIDRYAAVNSLLLKTYGEKCLDVSYDTMIKDMREISWKSSASEGGRQWVYQTCTEFGFFQTSDGKDQPFGQHFPLSYSLQMCSDIYGKQFNKSTLSQGIARTNTNYGGMGIRATKVIFPNGSIDPWHYLGITKDISDEEQAVYIHGTAHCANMYPKLPSDPPELVQARDTIFKTVEEWIQ
ncbi:thymus-specific serine protease-like [Asterias rubens]|uniref:thymus-specific serine protease-like n=1 Tax=Asterias rubens TaxID=7604 RepID=UPI001454EE15|nr:thymus-specific serine protease-like [Asterias rubens]